MIEHIQLSSCRFQLLYHSQDITVMYVCIEFQKYSKHFEPYSLLKSPKINKKLNDNLSD